MKVPPLGWLLSRLVDFRRVRWLALGGPWLHSGSSRPVQAFVLPAPPPLCHLQPTPPWRYPPASGRRARRPRTSARSSAPRRSRSCRRASSRSRCALRCTRGGGPGRASRCPACRRGPPGPARHPMSPPRPRPALQLRKKRLYLKQRMEEARAEANDGAVPVYAPDPQLAPSFDPEVTGYRYRVLEDPTGIISRCAQGGWDWGWGAWSAVLRRRRRLGGGAAGSAVRCARPPADRSPPGSHPHLRPCPQAHCVRRRG